MKLAYGSVSDDSTEGMSLVVHLPNVNGDSYKTLYSQGGYTGYDLKATAFMSSHIDTTDVLEGVQLKLSNGTMTGTFKLYGLSKA